MTSAARPFAIAAWCLYDWAYGAFNTVVSTFVIATYFVRAVAPDLELEEHIFGGAAILAHGTPLPDETLAAAREADAVLLGAVGLPQFDAADVRPEQGLLGLRKELGVYANLRPSRGNGPSCCSGSAGSPSRSPITC